MNFRFYRHDKFMVVLQSGARNRAYFTLS